MPCKMTKNWFKGKGHAFTEINVDDNLEGLNELITMNLRTLPVVFKDGEFVSMGFAPNKWEEFKQGGRLVLITLAGPIGVGKSSMTELLSELLETKAVYEPVEDNPLLEKFYADKKSMVFFFKLTCCQSALNLFKRP